MVYFTRRFVLSLVLRYFCSCVFSPFSIAITPLGEERANLSAFRTFVGFALVWFCLLPLPLGVWEGLRLVIVALPGLFCNLFYSRKILLAGDGIIYLHQIITLGSKCCRKYRSPLQGECTMRNVSLGINGERRSRSACASAHSNLNKGFYYPLIE